ncbi:MAG: flagellar basal-body rod protein FlgB [Deltaproteobacteria bacterium RBG_19FT_COMBO_56_10]|nr:MAG: flagellar basal-body rod protein FlgB [Deltaproteobacteria bacterium RBG_19FT_COMBO_56_10]
MPGGMFDSTINLLGSSLDLRAQRHKLLSSNIANQETPGYRAVDINFEQEMKKAEGSMPSGQPLSATNAMHISAGGQAALAPAVVDRVTDLEGYDRNSVGIEGEMARLSENTIMYKTSAQLLKHKFNILMTAIKEGGR